ncbi:MAG: SDR family oxidoreductase [Firmicutes bacterium]|nr:SDR family oxidoreductase [Bacillota bacterium]
MYAIITGASSGIGKEIAFELAKREINLVLVARRTDLLEQLKKEIESTYQVKVVVKSLDLSNKENCFLLHKETLQYYPEIFINNAGFGKVGFFSDVPLEIELSMIDLNIQAVHILTKLYSQTMEKGIILNVSSMAAFLSTPFLSTYAATKAYVLHLSEAVNYELKKQNKDVRVLTLCPGPVATEFGKVAEATMSLKGMTAKRCASIAVKGIFKKKRIIIPGAQMKLIHFLVKIIPTSLILAISYRIQNQKKMK